MTGKWFLVPAVERPDPVTGGVERLPKYADQVSQGFDEGHVVDMDQYGGPLTGEWYLVHYYGTESELDAIESNDDAHTRGEHGIGRGQIARFLNDRTGLDRTYDEWIDSLAGRS